MLAMYLELMLFSNQFRKIQTCTIICELRCNIISTANLRVCDVYLLNHAILV